ncbi:hypothetical protein CgunFtcFv8_009114 [Champsocephalus gunnari]|uniref:RPA interacting protein n=1 Tax=Champsocephalus gunnari TaxID=52237 RepID=A0AAN8HGP4_CHAGU|nr:hypothetical protein CgunFtcFv8_009114 [Champsocephalus gunnari]
MDAVHRHRSLYKGTTPPWKETFRKRCVDRLKNSRSRLLDRYRQASCRRRDRRLPSLWGPDGRAETLALLQEYDELSVLEEIQQELRSQELAILEELERNVQMEQQYISCVVEGMQEQRLIICPLCHMNNLNVNSHCVSCCCGLYINTQNQNITPDLLQSLLEARVSEHMEDCLQNPVFSVAPPTDGSPSLMISCKVCDYLSIVL